MVDRIARDAGRQKEQHATIDPFLRGPFPRGLRDIQEGRGLKQVGVEAASKALHASRFGPLELRSPEVSAGQVPRGVARRP